MRLQLQGATRDPLWGINGADHIQDRQLCGVMGEGWTGIRIRSAANMASLVPGHTRPAGRVVRAGAPVLSASAGQLSIIL